MKQTISIILLSFIIQLQANRLLQTQTFSTSCSCISPITGECSQYAPCPHREYCQTRDRTVNTAPTALTCNAYPNAQCRFTGCGGCFEYFLDSFGRIADCNVDICTLPSETGPCYAAFPRYFYNSNTAQCETFTYGGCGGNANNFNSLETCNEACKPHVAGDSCGVQGQDCMALGAPAALCSDGKTCYFNCGGCVYAENSNGNLVCSPQMISQDVCPVAGDICGTQGKECAAIRAAAFMCPDGRTCYANCGTCTYEDDGNNGLYCSSMIPRSRVCPL